MTHERVVDRATDHGFVLESEHWEADDAVMTLRADEGLVVDRVTDHGPVFVSEHWEADDAVMTLPADEGLVAVQITRSGEVYVESASFGWPPWIGRLERLLEAHAVESACIDEFKLAQKRMEDFKQSGQAL